MHESVNTFLKKAFDSSKEVFDGGLEDGIYVSKKDGHVILSDNYERMFAIQWKVTDNGEWSVKPHYDADWEPYTEVQGLQDASILYTG